MAAKQEKKAAGKYRGTIIAFHGCENAYQDKKYGAHMRVMNHAPGTSAERFRCTVCGGTK